MNMDKVNWDDIPSLEGLEVDWQFEPENPLGRREWDRIRKSDLHPLLDVKNIPVKVVSRNFDEKGYLIDIAKNGMAVILNTRLAEGQQIKIGLFLGKQKVLSRAVIRNVRDENGRYRTGMEFVDLNKEYESLIAGLISSKGYKALG
jgi:hypothetical protein